MIALVHKESEALGPWWLLVGVNVGLYLAMALSDSHFVQEPLSWRLTAGITGTAWGLGVLVGHSAVAHELREGHIELLDGLPVHRRTVFAAKLVACALPVLALVASSLALDVFLAWACRPPGALPILGPSLVLHLVMLAAGLGGLGLGALLSWAGPLAWGVLGVCAIAAMCANLVYPPSYAWLPLAGSLGELWWQGDTASHPWGPPLGWVLVGLLGSVCSGLLFLGPGRYLTDRGSQSVAVVRAGVLSVLSLVALLAGGGAGYRLLSEELELLRRGVLSLPSARGGFRIVYAPGNHLHAQHLADTVDALSDRVARMLGAPPSQSGPMDIELLGVPENHSGVFTGGKIRVEPDVRQRVLAHELAHAHAFALAGPAAYHQRDGTHFFQEGIAEWVEAQVAERSPVGPLAGAIHETGQARFEELVDSARHLARRDVEQSYVLGAAFVAALGEVGGEGALPCALREIGRSGREPVAGLGLWYGVASRCGFDLDRVQDRWLVLLQEARARIPGPLPRLRVRVRAAEARLEVRDELELGWALRCAFRRDADTTRERWLFREVEHGSCEVPTGSMLPGSFQYQVGFVLPRAADGRSKEALYLEWTEAGLTP